MLTVLVKKVITVLLKTVVTESSKRVITGETQVVITERPKRVIDISSSIFLAQHQLQQQLWKDIRWLCEEMLERH